MVIKDWSETEKVVKIHWLKMSTSKVVKCFLLILGNARNWVKDIFTKKDGKNSFQTYMFDSNVIVKTRFVINTDQPCNTFGLQRKTKHGHEKGSQ